MAHLSAWKFGAAMAVGLTVAALAVTRPLTAPLSQTLYLPDMTWLEVKAALDHGYDGVIVPSGGIEQNGPHMVLGKHDHIVRLTAQRIAEGAGRMLVAPVISYVPEGGYDPPTGHLLFPGTVGVSTETFAGILDGAARSLKAAGFRRIYFVADHGDSQKPQAEVAARLSRPWEKDGVRVIALDDYLADDAQIAYLKSLGESDATIGYHAGIIDTSELLAVHPAGVNVARLKDQPFTLMPSGASGDPAKGTAERGRALLDLKVQAALRQIRAQMPTQ